MRFLLTLLALIAGFATPGMTVATARAQVAGAEQVETARSIAPVAPTVRTASPLARASGMTAHAETVAIAECAHTSGCSIALSDRPLE
jgi:hypothetical protein